MDQLLNLDDGAVGLLKEMYGLFREDTPDRFKAMEAILATADLADLADLAHAIKGAAGTMGAPRLRAIGRGNGGSRPQGQLRRGAGLLLEQLKETYAEALEALSGTSPCGNPETWSCDPPERERLSPANSDPRPIGTP